jgi:hypothetical protein
LETEFLPNRTTLNPADPWPGMKQLENSVSETEQIEALAARITSYLSLGGLFNPELADHRAVRDLLMECRTTLAAEQAPSAHEREWMQKVDAAIEWIAHAPHGDNCHLTDEGDGSACVCGKESILSFLESDTPAARPPEAHQCIRPACLPDCSMCNSAISPATARAYALRYAWLREQPIDSVEQGGVFAGRTPENLVLNGSDLDEAIDAACVEKKNG